MSAVGAWWSKLSSEDRGALGIMAVPGVSLLGICAARGGGFDGLGALVGAAVDAGPVIGGIALAAAALGTLAKLGGGGASSQRTFRVHHEHGEYGIAARHEAGHAVMAQRIGCRVTDIRIYPDGTGYTEYQVPPTPLGLDFNPIGPVELGAVCVAGEVASGTKSGCGQDQIDFRGTVRGGGARSRAYSLARRTVGPGMFGGVPGRVASLERKLLARGRA